MKTMKTWLIFNPEEEWAGEYVEACSAKGALRGYDIGAQHSDYCHACNGNDNFVCPGAILITLRAAASRETAFDGSGEAAMKTYTLRPIRA